MYSFWDRPLYPSAIGPNKDPRQLIKDYKLAEPVMCRLKETKKVRGRKLIRARR